MSSCTGPTHVIKVENLSQGCKYPDPNGTHWYLSWLPVYKKLCNCRSIPKFCDVSGIGTQFITASLMFHELESTQHHLVSHSVYTIKSNTFACQF